MFKKCLVLLAALMSFASVLNAEEVSLSKAKFVGAVHVNGQQGGLPITQAMNLENAATINTENVSYAIKNVRKLRHPDMDRVIAYINQLDPVGYIVVSVDTNIRPIIAYSYDCNFDSTESDQNILLYLLRQDMRNRLELMDQLHESAKSQNQTLWNQYINQESNLLSGLYNTQTWGPHLQTTWGQQPHYNDSCPLDPVSGNRCITGCVATAMAQIIRYHEFPGSVNFSYNYTSRIDPDGSGSKRERRMNMSGTINMTFDYSSMPDNLSSSNQQVADLMFGCGVSVEMNYSDSASGKATSRIASALHRDFGYQPANTVYPSASNFYSRLTANMKNDQPAALAIRKSGSSGGHAIVCDGYKDTGEHHLNYGWRGSSVDTWYFLPNMGAGYDTIKYAVMDIRTGAQLNVSHSNHTINDDNSGASSGNNNERAEAGEHIELLVTLRNELSTQADGVTATLSTTSPHVTITDRFERFGNIPANGTAQCKADYDFTVSPNLTSETAATLRLDIRDSHGNTNLDTFTITLYPVDPSLDIKYHSSTIDDDNSGGSHGNGDGQLNAGEDIELKVTLRNDGNVDRRGVRATLSSSDPYVTAITDNYEYFGNISAGRTAQCSYDYDIEISPNCPDSHWLEFVLNIRDADGGTCTENFKLTSHTPPPQQFDVGYHAHSIDDDNSGGSHGNGDNKLNEGETAELLVTLKNFESTQATGVRARLSTSDSYVTITDSYEYYGNIPGGGTKQCQFDYDFRVAQNCPDDHVIVFTLDIEDSNGNSNSATFNVIVEPSSQPFDVELSTITIDDDNSGGSRGNGDAQVNPGETIELVVTLRNLESTQATGVSARLSTSDSYVTMTDSYEYYGNIPGGGTKQCQFDYDFRVAQNCPDGHVVNFTLNARDGNGKTDTLTFDVTVRNPNPFDVEISTITIDDDNSGGSRGNGDHTVHSGETIELLITLRNLESTQATGVSARLSTSDSYVTMTDSYEYYGNIPGGGTKQCQFDYDFRVAQNCPDGHVVNFTLNARDGNGNTDTMTFNITVRAPVIFNVELHSSTIDDDNSGGSRGNGDAQVNPGESIELVVTLRNLESTQATGVSARLSTSDSYVTMTDSYEYYGNIPGGGTKQCQFDYDFRVAQNCPGGHVIPFTLTAIDSSGRTNTIPLNITVSLGPPPPQDDAYEENDSISAAALLAGNGAYSSLKCLDDDWYKVYAYSGDILGVTITFTDSTSDLDLKLTNSNGSTLAGSYSITDNESISYIVTSNGYYYIKVYDYGGNTNTYDMNISGIGQGGGSQLLVSYHSYSIDDDNSGGSRGNGDHILNPGEDVELVVTLQNTGSQSASGVRATLSTNDPYVINITDYYEYFGNISASGTAQCQYDYDFEVRSSCPVGHIITFTLVISDSGGRTTTDNFDVPVGGSPPNDDAYENNDTLSTAASLPGNGTYNSLVCRDDDWYKVYAYSGDILVVAITFTDSISDLDLKLTNSNGSRLAGSYSVTDNESLSYTIPNNGYYYIKVYDYGGNGNTYSMTISGISGGGGSVDDIYEENDSLSSPAIISLGSGSGLTQTTFQNLRCRDADYYKFWSNGSSTTFLNSGDRATVSIAFTHSSGDLDLKVYNSSGTLVGGAYSITNNESVTFTVSSSYYIVYVYGYAGATNDYTLTITKN